MNWGKKDQTSPPSFSGWGEANSARGPLSGPLVLFEGIQHNLKFEQLCTGSNRLAGLLPFFVGVCGLAFAGPPCVVGFLVGPAGDHEVAVLALHRTQKLEAFEARLAVDSVLTGLETLLEFFAGTFRDSDCVDFDNAHGPIMAETFTNLEGHIR